MKPCYNRNNNHSVFGAKALRSAKPDRKDAMNKLCCRMGDFLKGITCCEIEKKYDLSLSLYADGEAQVPECSHTLQGSSRHKLWKLLGICAAVVITVALLRTVCRLLRLGKK